MQKLHCGTYLLGDLDAPAFPKRSAGCKALVGMGPFAATILGGGLSQNRLPEMDASMRPFTLLCRLELV